MLIKTWFILAFYCKQICNNVYMGDFLALV